uniref:Helically-extended SH3 domain-containing protein n=1 Tax=Hippocampus comes TaxID=109280 RepID=A0A3Q2XNS9_HIPCM
MFWGFYSVDAIVEKELRKKFKYEGPLRVLQTVMINPNGVMKKPGKKDLHVSPGDVVDIIQLTNSKKALCHNRRSGNYKEIHTDIEINGWKQTTVYQN